MGGELYDCVKLRRASCARLGPGMVYKNRGAIYGACVGFWVRFSRLVRDLVSLRAGAPGARRSERGRLYILILHRLLIYTYTHSIYNILDIIYII